MSNDNQRPRNFRELLDEEEEEKNQSMACWRGFGCRCHSYPCIASQVCYIHGGTKQHCDCNYQPFMGRRFNPIERPAPQQRDLPDDIRMPKRKKVQYKESSSDSSYKSDIDSSSSSESDQPQPKKPSPQKKSTTKRGRPKKNAVKPVDGKKVLALRQQYKSIKNPDLFQAPPVSIQALCDDMMIGWDIKSNEVVQWFVSRWGWCWFTEHRETIRKRIAAINAEFRKAMNGQQHNLSEQHIEEGRKVHEHRFGTMRDAATIKELQDQLCKQNDTIEQLMKLIEKQTEVTTIRSQQIDSVLAAMRVQDAMAASLDERINSTVDRFSQALRIVNDRVTNNHVEYDQQFIRIQNRYDTERSRVGIIEGQMLRAQSVIRVTRVGIASVSDEVHASLAAIGVLEAQVRDLGASEIISAEAQQNIMTDQADYEQTFRTAMDLPEFDENGHEIIDLTAHEDINQPLIGADDEDINGENIFVRIQREIEQEEQRQGLMQPAFRNAPDHIVDQYLDTARVGSQGMYRDFFAWSQYLPSFVNPGVDRPENLLECPVCMEPHVAGMIMSHMPCTHQICRVCIRAIVVNGPILQCPICRAAFPRQHRQ